MVSCRLYGGLGNYMFQIATTRAYSVEYNMSDCYPIENAVRVHRNASDYVDTIFSNLNVYNDFNSTNIYKQGQFGYSKIPKYESVILDGYFQSEKYFVDYRDWILDLFKPTKDVQIYIDNKFGNIDWNNSTSIHVRRGNYLNLQHNHPVQDINYYSDAIEEIGGHKFIVFSDDIEWCKSVFEGDAFTFIQGEEDYIDLYLMSQCKNNIIANSSFSWWGAWLNDNNKKRVISPKRWFGPNLNHDTSDLIPDEWMKI
jgi:hypothetical protein